MPRPKDPEATRRRQFDELPLAVRTDIAQGRNVRARMIEKKAAWLEESRLFKSIVIRLHRRHHLTKNKIALMLNVSTDWVGEILNGKRESR